MKKILIFKIKISAQFKKIFKIKYKYKRKLLYIYLQINWNIHFNPYQNEYQHEGDGPFLLNFILLILNLWL